jgi:DNA-directed RNA polymerase sigma subunit (sigma70/sigma32)
MAKQASARKAKVTVARSAKAPVKEAAKVKVAPKAAVTKAANANGRAKTVKPNARDKAKKPALDEEAKKASGEEEEEQEEVAEGGLDFAEPSPEQLAKEEAETKKALRDMERNSSGDSTLSRYFREMANHRVLTPAEEVECAQTVERLEIGYWEALFSYPAAFETVACILEVVCPEPVPELAHLRKMAKTAKTGKFQKRAQDKWDKLAKAASTRLRELDSDRLFVSESDEAVHRLVGKYAGRARHARRRGAHHFGVQTVLIDVVDAARLAQKRAKNRFVAANLRLVVSDRASL